MTQFVFVTGGVISSLGKGITAASLATVLKSRKLSVGLLKMDPYINIDPGTMSPFQHGEVFVTEDGYETDLDLGHYERFTQEKMLGKNSCTAGKIYLNVINREREGDYLGQTVQVIPHITDEIQSMIHQAAEGKDVLIVEVGGTVGDIESLPFIEAIRQLHLKLPAHSTAFVHLTYLPFIRSADEVKTKPTQRSVRDMLSIGIQPDILICRSENLVDASHLRKIALFTNVNEESVFSIQDVDSIYGIPALLSEKGVDQAVLKRLGRTDVPPADLMAWGQLQARQKIPPKKTVCIALIGKYVGLRDAYLSLLEALNHAGNQCALKLDIEIIDSELWEKFEADGSAKRFDGIVIPGGFGERGVEGKISAIRYTRQNKVPMLGICMGMQLLVIEYARHVCEMRGANSTEIDFETPYPVIALIEQWQDDRLGEIHHASHSAQALGGTMRLGMQNIHIKSNSLAFEIYGEIAQERHRHRYEFNAFYQNAFEEKGLRFSGFSSGGLVEIVELNQAEHPWFLATQFHPEFTSSPLTEHPLFLSFVTATFNR